MPIDLILWAESSYGVGHGNDVSFLFDYPNAENIWKILYQRTTPDPWHYETSDIWQNNYSKFFAFQHPLSYWKQFQYETLDLLYISNNETNAITTMENGMNDAMEFWLNIYNKQMK